MGKFADSISVTRSGRFGTRQPRAMRRYCKVHTTPERKAEDRNMGHGGSEMRGRGGGGGANAGRVRMW